MTSRFTFGTGLYHPFIDIDDGPWLRNAILFWDEIQTIAPSDIEKPYRGVDSMVLHAEGYLTPVRCDLHGDLLNDLGRRVMSIISDPAGPFRGRFRNATGRRQELLHADKVCDALRDRFQMARMHPQKMSPELRALFANERADESNFLLVDAEFANFYVSVLAARLAQDLNASPVSNGTPSFEANLRTIVDEVATKGPSPAAGALAMITMENIVIDPAIPIEQLLRFRRKNTTLLERVVVEFDKLGEQIKAAETADELKEKASRLYQRDVRPRLESLKEALDDQYIGSLWGGLTMAATVSVGSAAPLASIVGLKGAVLMGAGAFLTLSNFAVQSHFSMRKARRDSPFTYVADLERSFSLPKDLVV